MVTILQDGNIAGIGKAGNPDTMDNITPVGPLFYVVACFIIYLNLDVYMLLSKTKGRYSKTGSVFNTV